MQWTNSDMTWLSQDNEGIQWAGEWPSAPDPGASITITAQSGLTIDVYSARDGQTVRQVYDGADREIPFRLALDFATLANANLTTKGGPCGGDAALEENCLIAFPRTVPKVPQW